MYIKNENIELMKKLTNAELGELMRALIAFTNGELIKVLSPKTKRAFEKITKEKKAVPQDFKDDYTIDDVNRLCENLCPILLQRQMSKFHKDYQLGQTIMALQGGGTTLKEIAEVIKKANATYIATPKYSTLDLVWVLNNIEKVKGIAIDEKPTAKYGDGSAYED